MSHTINTLSAKVFAAALSMSLLVGCAGPSAPSAARPTDLTLHRSADTSEAVSESMSGSMAVDEAAGAVAETAADAAAEAGPVTEESDWERPVASPMESDRAASPIPASPSRSRQYEPVTAGVVDDNARWQEYLDYRERHAHVHARPIDVRERIQISVADEQSLPVHDAHVEVLQGDRLLFTGRTDTSGRLLFHPRAVPSAQWQVDSRQAHPYRVVVAKGQVQANQLFERQAGNQWTLTLDAPFTAGETQLDLLFLMDATGSMGDEIAKLKASMADVADEIARLPEQPDVRYGLVAYRDLGDSYVVQNSDFTSDLGRFQRTLSGLRADGGGDEPESLNEALNTAVYGMNWRSEDTVRMVVLVADAPPHLDYDWQPFSYETDVVEAVRRGIKLFPVGASGLNEDGEYIFRQLAQFTGGKFVFLTYADASNPGSGPGVETEHDVANYSVETLDRLIVELVQEELAQLPQMTQQRQPAQAMASQ